MNDDMLASGEALIEQGVVVSGFGVMANPPGLYSDAWNIKRTGRLACSACEAKRIHTEEDWQHHPLRGHGFTKEQGWSHPDLAKEAELVHD